MTMKAAIFNPYLDTLGGGERYCLAVATSLRDAGFRVDLEWKESLIKTKLEDRFGINLDQVNFIPSVNKGEGYDLCFWLSDGSIPLLHSRKNIIHFQVPFHNVGGGSLLNRMKLIRVSKVVCNSHFTKKIIDQEFRVKSEVLYPPVDVEKIKPKRKENTILFVGRFSQLKQSKNQHVLITAFKKFLKKHSNWKLVLVGGVEIGGEEYFQRLNREIEGYEENITLVKSPTYKELLDYYGKAKFFWSAVGFGIDENKDPEKVEHFGITLVEAMSAGCVPLVFRAGGYKEIISEGSGLFWKKEKELVDLTEKLINGPYLKLKSVSQNAVARSKIFSYNNFSTNFLKLI